MNALAVGLLLLVEESVLVLGQHLLFTGHFLVPTLDSLGVLTIPGECSADGIDDTVHSAQALALPGLLRRRETPWGLPVRRKKYLSDFNASRNESDV